jgi:hypothetical protein
MQLVAKKHGVREGSPARKHSLRIGAAFGFIKNLIKI